MRHTLAVLLATACTAAAQNQIHYKFDSVGSPTIVNYANSALAAATTKPTYGPERGYVPGKFGPGALAAAVFGLPGNFVDSGWTGPFSGSATFAFFLRNQYANVATIRSGMIGRKGFGISTGGEAGGGLMMKGWGGQTLKVRFGNDLCFLTGWHHYAIVIDAANKKAVWYFDGKPHQTVAITTGFRFAKADPLLVGRDHFDHCGSRYAMDDFRFTTRAVAATEILAWATRNQAAYGGYGVRPLPRHDLTVRSGRPVIGTASYSMQLAGRPQAPFALAWGMSRVRFGNLVLPLDLGKRGKWFTSIELFVPGVLDDDGWRQLPVVIPADKALDQVSFHTQAILVGDEGGFGVSNAIAHVIGY